MVFIVFHENVIFVGNPSQCNNPTKHQYSLRNTNGLEGVFRVKLQNVWKSWNFMKLRKIHEIS